MMIIFILVINVSILWIEASSAGHQISIRMPDIRPDHAEQYLCIAHRLPSDEDGRYIVGLNPKGDASRVHHMLMHGCELPGILQRDSPNFVWDCGEMGDEASHGDETYERGPVCDLRLHHKLMYGWALNAPALKLPESVGFEVGSRRSKIHYLVLQVHYGHFHAFQMLPDLTDNSGLVLDMKLNNGQSGITKQAGVLVLISVGHVEQGKSQHEIWCDIDDDITIHPFRYRVHTHKLGYKVMGVKIAGTKNTMYSTNFEMSNDVTPEIIGQNQLIGEGDPQKPQMFYPVKEQNLTLGYGDKIYARCEYNNNSTHVVEIGATGNDEMCNFYMMYWTENAKLLSKDVCYSRNPKKYFGIW